MISEAVGSRVVELFPGKLGTADTVAEMQRRVRDAYMDNPPAVTLADRLRVALGVSPYKRKFLIRRACEWIVKPARGGDRRAEALEIFRFTKDHVRYTRDMTRAEWLLDPRVTIARIDRYRWAAEDCDGHAMLSCALGLAIQLPMKFVLVSTREDGGWNHVYAAMQIGETSPEWLAGDDGATSGLLCMDTASPEAGFDRHCWANKRLVVDSIPKE